VPLLRVRGVSKAYPGVQALSGVDLDVDPGEVHALLGQNGAGKSTLMKAIAGFVTPDQGLVEVDGTAVPHGSPEVARARGIGIVYQELSVVPQRSVAENVVLGRWPMRWGGRFVDWPALHEQARERLRRVGFDVDPDRPVSELGMAERQLVELAKALSPGVRVLLLDEPTSALSEREAIRLFSIIRDLKAQGVAIIYVSHHLKEIVEISDRVTVMRDGTVADTVETAGVDEQHLARLMVGRATSLMSGAAERDIAPSNGRRVALRTRGMGRPPRLKPVDLELAEGEIVGVFGLVGAGRSRLAKTLFGLEPATEGEIEVLGTTRRIRRPDEAIAAGLGYVGEDRQAGLVPRMSVAENITLASFDKIVRGGFMDFAAERRTAQQYVDDLGIRTASLATKVENLSGGNQQKVVLARWSCSGARVLILDDPTRGIDVGAKEEVFRLVRRLATEGVAVLYLTSEIREARALSDRLLVMADGRVVAELDPATPEEEIMSAAGGVHA
jgi:ABC-type sugar transport system ATPase subunit